MLSKVFQEFGEFKTVSKMFRRQDDIPLSDIHRGDTTMQRIMIWQNTVRMIKDKGFLGVGLGNFKLAYQPYRTKKEQISTGPDVFVRRTHNEYLQLTAELGIMGIIAFLMIQFTLYRMGHQLLIRSRRFIDQCLIMGFVMAFMAIFVTATFGFALQNPNPAYTLWMLVALFCSFHWFLWYDEENRAIEVKSFSLSPSRFFKEKIHTLSKRIPFLSRSRNNHDDGTFFLQDRTKKFLLPIFIPIFLFGLFGHYWIWKPATAFYYRQFGQALQRMGLHRKASIIFEKSLKDESLAWETLFLLANEYAAMNRFDEAIETHLRSLSLNPYHAKGHYNLGNALNKLGQDDEALKCYELAVRYDYMLYQGFCNLGAMYFKKHDFEKSIVHYKRSLEINPKFFSAYYNISYALCGLGRIGEAIPFLQKAKELRPTNEKVLKLEKRVLKIINQARANQLRLKQQQALAQAEAKKVASANSVEINQ